MVVIACLSPFLANDRPLVCKYKGEWLFPAVSTKHQVVLNDSEIVNYHMGKDWKLLSLDFSIFPPCAYSPNSLDPDNATYKSPFDSQYITSKNGITSPLPFKFRHWLGTTQNGNDILSGLIHGTKVSLTVSILSMLIAAFIGILLGAFSGYFGNNLLQIGYVQLFFASIGAFLAWFYAIVVKEEQLIVAFNTGGMDLILTIFSSIMLIALILFTFIKLGKWIDTALHFHKKMPVPIDSFISRIIEVLNSIPSLLIVIAISVVTKPSFTLLVLLIGLLSWADIARVVRAEYLKAKGLDYIASCQAIGMSHYRIMFKHILINALPIIAVQLIFVMAGAVLLEASLSFIGVGIPIEMVSWGSLLNEAKDHYTSWWLVLFPGLCLFMLMYLYNKVASELSKINSGVE